MFSATEAVKRKLSSATNAISRSAALPTSISRTSAPSTSTVPSLGSYSRAINPTRLVLPEPEGPTSATVLAGLDLEVDVVERRRLRRS